MKEDILLYLKSVLIFVKYVVNFLKKYPRILFINNLIIFDSVLGRSRRRRYYDIR